MHPYGGFQPNPAKVFVSLSEEYRTRHAQNGNAVMADVIGRATLGHAPLETIADDLASRFGGYPADFVVAGYQERDYVIFLPT